MLPDWSPNVHPLIVHFPIALFFVAALFDGVALVLREKHAWMRTSAASLYALAALGTAAAFLTGRDASDNVALPIEAVTTLNAHADWALYLVWFASLYALLRLVALWRMDRPSLRVDGPLAALGLVSLLLVVQTAERGGEMVYRYGVGVAAALHDAAAPDPGISAAQPDASADPNPALEGVRSLSGAPPSGDVLTVAPGQPSLLVLGDPLADLEVRAQLDLTGFVGTAMLLHHVADAQNYDFLALDVPGGGGPVAVRQGRVRSGAEQVFDSGTATLSGPALLRAYAVGTHFRGYVGGEQVTHGHDDAAPAGPVGLRFAGEGTVRILSLGTTEAE